MRSNPILGALAAIAVAAVIALGHRQLLEPIALTTRDHTDAYLRTQQYARELSQGHWPQTLPDAVQGAGHAFPRYYPPVSQWTTVALYGLTGDVVAATHLAGFAAIILAGLTCFMALRLLGAGIPGAAVGAALYGTLPYTWVALDIRGAFAETWALICYPLILAGMVRSLRENRPVPWLAPVVAASAMSHLVMTAWAVPVLALVALWAAGPVLRWASVRRTMAHGLLGLGIAAFFIAPPLLEVGLLRAADPVVMRATPESLVSVNWQFYEDVFRSFRWWDALEWGLLLLGLVGLWQARRDAAVPRRLCWAALVAYAALAILSRAPVEVWRLVPQAFRYIQFPERLLGIGGLFLAATLAIAMSWLRSRPGQVAVVVTGALVTLHATQLGRQVLPRSGETGAEVLERLETSYPDRGLTVVGEYLPRGTEPEALAEQIRRTRAGIGSPPLLSWQPTEGGYRAVANLESEGEVRLPLVSYPFYRVTGPQGPMTVEPAGQLTLRLGPGTHELIVARRTTPVSVTGLLISLVSFLVWVVPVGRRTISRDSMVSSPL